MREPDDIKNIARRINEFKDKHASLNKAPSIKENAYTQTSAGFQISVELLSGVLIGAGIGYVLDKLFSSQPWLIVIFTILGGAAGILNIYKTFKVENSSKE